MRPEDKEEVDKRTDGTYRFGEFQLDLEREQLLRADEVIDLRPQSFAVLTHIIRASGRLVSKSDLMASVWGKTVVTEDSLRQCLMEIRRALGESGHGVIQTAPRRGYRVTIPVTYLESRRLNGSSVAPVDGTDADSSPGRRIALAVLGLAAAGLGFVLFQSAFHQPVEMHTEPAVLRFSPDEAIVRIRPLVAVDSDIGNLADIAQSTIAVELNRYGIQAIIQAEGAETMPPGFVLGTTLVDDHDRLYIDVRIEDATSGSLLWSERYQDEGGDVNDLIEQAAAETAYVVECGLIRLGALGKPTPSRLLSMYMSGCADSVNQRRSEHYEQALEIASFAPNDANSHAHLSLTLSRLALARSSDSTNEDLLAAARAAAETALTIDPDLPEALLGLSAAMPFYQWEQKEALIEQALNGPRDYRWTRSEYVQFLRRVGRLEDALQYSRRLVALARGPNHQVIHAWLLAISGRLREAIDVLDDVDRKWPDNSLSGWQRFEVEVFLGDVGEAERLLSDAGFVAHVGPMGSLECWRTFVAARKSNTDENVGALRAECSIDAEYALPRVLAAFGRVDESIAALEIILDEWDRFGHMHMPMILFNSEMAPVRRDPRFVDIAARLGLTRYWMSTERWPDFCTDPDLQYNCIAAIREASASGL